jgi:tRNA threonylcarbamoyladenosine biosynthesis protein TsaB
MIILALDTCLAACSAAILDQGRVLAARSEPMARGHQERLAPMVAEIMAEAGLAFSDLDRIGVTLGPGSFTGLRVGLAFAKGLGAALSIPVVGVGVLEALAADQRGLAFAVMDAKRGQIYLQAFDAGKPLMAPDALDLGTAAARLAELAGGRPTTLVGPGAPLLADVLADARILTPDHADPVVVARLAAARAPVPPRPLYLRAPDAKLPGGLDLPGRETPA